MPIKSHNVCPLKGSYCWKSSLVCKAHIKGITFIPACFRPEFSLLHVELHLLQITFPYRLRFSPGKEIMIAKKLECYVVKCHENTRNSLTPELPLYDSHAVKNLLNEQAPFCNS